MSKVVTPQKKVSDPINAASLSKFLLGAIGEVKREEITIEKAEAISKLADKITKVNLVRMMYNKSRNMESAIEFFEETEGNLLLNAKS